MYLCVKWREYVNNHCGGNTEIYRNRLVYLKLAWSRARDGRLPSGDVAAYRHVADLFNFYLGVTQQELRLFNRSFRYEGRPTRIPMEVITEFCSGLLKYQNHGGCYRNKSRQMPHAFPHKFTPVTKDAQREIMEAFARKDVSYLKGVLEHENQRRIEKWNADYPGSRTFAKGRAEIDTSRIDRGKAADFAGNGNLGGTEAQKEARGGGAAEAVLRPGGAGARGEAAGDEGRVRAPDVRAERQEGVRGEDREETRDVRPGGGKPVLEGGPGREGLLGGGPEQGPGHGRPRPVGGGEEVRGDEDPGGEGPGREEGGRGRGMGGRDGRAAREGPGGARAEMTALAGIGNGRTTSPPRGIIKAA